MRSKSQGQPTPKWGEIGSTFCLWTYFKTTTSEGSFLFSYACPQSWYHIVLPPKGLNMSPGRSHKCEVQGRSSPKLGRTLAATWLLWWLFLFPKALQNPSWMSDWNLWAMHSIISFLDHAEQHLIAQGLYIPTFRESDFVTTPFTHINYDSTAPHKVSHPLFSSYNLFPPSPTIPMLRFLMSHRCSLLPHITLSCCFWISSRK